MAHYPNAMSLSDDGYSSGGSYFSYLSREPSEYGDGDLISTSGIDLEQGQEQGQEREEAEEPMEYNGHACAPALAAVREGEFRTDLTNTCLILILGREPTQTRFCVNKQLLCHHSPILNVVLNHDVEYEDGVQVYRVEAAGHRLAFAFLIQWFNRKKIDPLLGEEGLLIPASYFTRADRHRLMNGEDMALIRAWLVADRWEVPECRAYIERRIRGRYGHFRHGSVDCLVYVWRSTSVGSSNEGLREVYWPVFQWVVRTYNIGAFELEELLSSEEANLPLP